MGGVLSDCRRKSSAGGAGVDLPTVAGFFRKSLISKEVRQCVPGRQPVRPNYSRLPLIRPKNLTL
jgi:hypothetical protein